MNLPTLIEVLSRSTSYPHPAPSVEVHQTHISVVFLAGRFAYKIKKPVNLGFLDFHTLAQRQHYCQEEVRLNRRLAPDVYLGVVPVTAAGFVEDGVSEVIEWAVKMVRLPAAATLLARLQRGEVTAATMTTLAQTVAAFHRTAERGPGVSALGCFNVVASLIRQNFEQSTSQVGVTVQPAVFERLRLRTEIMLNELRPVIEDRARRGVPREGHGDLHLDHVYLFPDELASRKLIIVDCIEFSRLLRSLDPVADMAFVVMDLKFHGRPDLAEAFADAYFQDTADEEGRRLLPLYVSYRALVRAKVEGVMQAESEIPDAERTAARERARAHWRLALEELEAGLESSLPTISGASGLARISRTCFDR